ncbi:MAG: putative sulfate exporter family transporter, partial [Alistipes sp.]|nr:putative sulfate exporter family transporter [Alistipes sp.]
MKKFLVEDWVVTLLSIPILLLCGFAYYLPEGGPKVPSTLLTQSAWAHIGFLFLIALVVLYIGNKLLSRPTKGLFWSFVVLFAVSILAQVVANVPFIKRFGFEAV